MRGRELADEERVRALAELVDDIVIRASLGGVVEYISQNACGRLATEPEAVIGRSVRELLHPDDRERVLAALWRSVETAGRERARLLRGDGTWLPAEVTGMTHEDRQGHKALLVIGRDLRSRLREEREEAGLDSSEAQFRLLADTVPAILWMSSPDGGMTVLNRAGHEFLGHTKETNTHKLREVFVHPEDREPLREGFEGAILRRSAFTTEARFRDATGSYRWLFIRGVPRFGPEGEFAGLVGVTFDVTDQKLAEASLSRAERLASIGTLATGIAHEINNPLAAIKSATEGALTTLGREPSFRSLDQSLKRILTQVERATKITRDLLHFARSEPLGAEPRDLNGVVLELVDQLRGNIRAAHATVECQLDPNLPRVPIARTEMVYAIANLLQNAVASSERPVHVRVRTEARGDRVLLSVSDDGDGIPEDTLTQIFDPFFTTRRHCGATGMGLSLAQRIVRDHDGTIEVQSTVDRGTSFIVTLPAHTP
jgi:two-component system sporulation sensor kinase A